MRKCQFCAEEIQDEAIKCKHCGEWLNEKIQVPPQVVQENQIKPLEPVPEDVILLEPDEEKVIEPRESDSPQAIQFIDDMKKANSKILKAVIGGVICGVLTIIISLSSVSYLLGLGEWSLLSGGIVLGLSFGIYKRNSLCAVLLFTYFVSEKVLQIYEGNAINSSRTIIIQGIIFGYLFFQGIRGTFAYHKILRDKTEPSPQVPQWVFDVGVLAVIVVAVVLIIAFRL